MNMYKLLKKRLLIFFLSTLFVVIMIIVSSYVFFYSPLNSDVTFINNSHLEVFYDFDKGGYFETVQQGNGVFTKSIKIINNKNSLVYFSLKVTAKEEKGNLGYDKIYYSINEMDPKLLSETLDDVVYYNRIKAHDEFILDIKAWLASENMTNADKRKRVNLKFEILEE